jgi:hypothetical protein
MYLAIVSLAAAIGWGVCFNEIYLKGIKVLEI